MNVDNINKLLDLQLTELTNLQKLLINELNVLKNRELESLEVQTQAKEKVLANINQLDQTINQHAKLKDLHENPLFTKKTEQIIELFSDCKQQNEINGQIINNTQISINRFKTMLQKSITNNSMTYDEKGKTNINIRSIGIKA
ncbi:MAG: flagellar protein FlgN [Alteromonadaceae bacterium]|nr:flagellar protein FlgN [Alteromonadaceae bacterium]